MKRSTLRRGALGSAILAVLVALSASPAFSHNEEQDSGNDRFVHVLAGSKQQRTQLESLGMSIEFVLSDRVGGFASREILKDIKAAGFTVTSDQDMTLGRGGHESIFDFPSADARFHNYAEIQEALQTLSTQNSDITRLVSIGKSLEGRELWAIHINTDANALVTGQSEKPGVIFVGAHHAREHVSSEMPLMLAQHLLAHKGDVQMSELLAERDIWIVPLVNPDGSEYDISSGNYRMWRKNRRDNGDGTRGVDLNRNYGYKWGSGGSSSNGSSDVYMGKEPFSEPETQAVREFFRAHRNVTIDLSFHTFSELVLYPWGHKYDPIENERDRRVHEIMARTMAGWNKYTPQQSSDLYIASGDTTDWAYGELGMISFTFELSPSSMWQGGFYPGAGVLDKVFEDNLRPCLYLIDLADNPYRVLDGNPSFLRNYKLPEVPGAGLSASL